jgi:hypothetical protein
MLMVSRPVAVPVSWDLVLTLETALVTAQLAHDLGIIGLERRRPQVAVDEKR